VYVYTALSCRFRCVFGALSLCTAYAVHRHGHHRHHRSHAADTTREPASGAAHSSAHTSTTCHASNDSPATAALAPPAPEASYDDGAASTGAGVGTRAGTSVCYARDAGTLAERESEDGEEGDAAAAGGTVGASGEGWPAAPVEGTAGDVRADGTRGGVGDRGGLMPLDAIGEDEEAAEEL